MNRKTRRYIEKFKQEAVNLALKSATVDATARELGIPGATLHVWVNKVSNRGMVDNLGSNDSKSMANLIEENIRLKKHGLICSMSRKGNCWDNAVAGSFFHTLKTELIYTEKYETRDNAKQSIFQYIEIYYNRIRRHSILSFVAPSTFEQQLRNAT
jgi:transposase InsO family protein